MKESGEAAFALLKFTSAAADAFPPLKGAVGGALYITEIVMVHLSVMLCRRPLIDLRRNSSQNMIQWGSHR